MLYPLPAVLVSSRAGGVDNLCTVAWTGTVCTNPAMLSISLRPSRLTYTLVRKSGVFGVNLTTEALSFATDFCGVRSGRDEDKWKACGLTREESVYIDCPLVGEAPVGIECRVRSFEELGSHTLFIAEVLAVHADSAFLREDGVFDLDIAKPLVYSHGVYRGLGRKLGTFGFSVKKKNANSANRKKARKTSDNKTDK